MKKRLPYIIGLTGGIGSGKSTVAERFAALGAGIVDADVIARELVRPGSPALEKIRTRFGDDILNADQSLNRRALRQRIFSGQDDKKWLEDLLHPQIREEILEQCRHTTAPYVLLVVPLLLESQRYDFIDRILVVDLPETQQIERVSRRDQSSEQEVRAIMASQLPRSERLARADDIIDNSDSLDTLQTQVQHLHDFYQQQAEHHSG